MLWQGNCEFQSYGLCVTPGHWGRGFLVFWRDLAPLFTRWSAPARIRSYVSHLRRPELFILAFMWLYLFCCVCLDICSLVYLCSCLLIHSLIDIFTEWLTVIMSSSTCLLCTYAVTLFYLTIDISASVHFTWWQAVHLPLLLQFAMSQRPHILIQCIAVNIRFFTYHI
jgi:hypothetical protein